MPRHPPNALISLDRSHCQCSSFNQPPPIQATPGQQRHRRVDMVLSMQSRRRLRGHVLRPASRDMSRGARSGNTNPASPPEPGPEGPDNSRHTSGQDPLCKGTIRTYLLFTMFKEQAEPPTGRLQTCFLIRMSSSNRQQPARSKPQPKLVELSGIEPLTPCLQSRCSPS